VAGAFFVFLRAFLKGVLEKGCFGCGFSLVRLWWISGGWWWLDSMFCGGPEIFHFFEIFFQLLALSP